MKTRIPPWAKLDCTKCGELAEATRSESAQIGVKKFKCDDCGTYDDAYGEGHNDGLEAAVGVLLQAATYQATRSPAYLEICALTSDIRKLKKLEKD